MISVKVTPVNVADRKPMPEISDKLWGCSYGDKGYIYDP
ncbi:transposase [Candidatus Enterovibrio escicola]|nr:transposase [Candidatus Enterovibrio escacola]